MSQTSPETEWTPLSPLALSKPNLTKLPDAQDRFMREVVANDKDLLGKILQHDTAYVEGKFRTFVKKHISDLSDEMRVVEPSGSDDDITLITDHNKKISSSIIEPLHLKAIDHSLAMTWARDRILRDLQQYYSLSADNVKNINMYLEKRSLSELEHLQKLVTWDKKSRLAFFEKIDGIDPKKLERRFKKEAEKFRNKKNGQTIKAETPAEVVYETLSKKGKNLTTSEILDEIKKLPDTDKREKLVILREFVPYVSIADIISSRILPISEEQQNNLIKEALVRNLRNIDNVDVSKIELPADFTTDVSTLGNVFISTTDSEILRTLDSDELIKIIEKHTYLLSEQKTAFNLLQNEVREATLGALAELNLTPEGPDENIHVEFVRKATDKTGNTSLENLQKHGYIEFILPDENNIPTKRYFKILDINQGSTLEDKSLKVINLTGPDGYLNVEPKDENPVDADLFSYIELYHLLKYNPHSVKCFNTEDFKTHKNTNQLKELPSMDTKGKITDTVLQNFLELNDPEGVKYGLDKGTCFTFESGTWENKGIGTCRVLEIDMEKQKIKLTNTKDSEMNLNDFVAAFAAMKAKRIAKFNDTQSMLTFLQQEAHDDIKKGFKEVAFKDGKLLESDKSDAPEIKHLLGESDKIIEIHKWNGDQVQITTGKLEEKDKTSKNGVDSVKREIKPDHKPAWVGIEEFYQQINAIKAKPFKQPKNEIPTGKTDSTPLKRKFSFGGMVEAGLSFAQIMGTMKLAKDPIFNFFKRNDEEHSAELALKLYGRFMPEEIRKNFEKKIDKARAESVSKFKDMITGWPHVRKILEKSNVERFELEAAMLYTMEKAGTLYPEKLAPLQFSGGNPTYAWYRALGGTPNDALFMSIKRECETNKNPQGEPDPIPFTEERLVEKLLKIQGSDIKDFKDATKDRAKYDIKYKCRGGVDKEFAAAKVKGIKEWVDDGEKKLSDEVTTAGKLKTIISALKDSKYAAAFWGLSKLLESNGKREEMYKATILIALSGVGTTLDKEVTAKLPGFSKYPYPPLLFMTSPGDTKLFQNTCLALMGNSDKLSSALKETDMKKKIEAIEKFLDDGDNNKKLAEFLTGNDKEHVIFTEKDGNKSHSNTYYQFYAKVSDKVKEHKTSPEGMEKRVYTKKHSAMIWFDQSAEYIGTPRLNHQTTDLDESDANTKKFKDALEAYEDLLKAIKWTKSRDEKKAYYSRFKYLFERLYIPARRVINSRMGKMSRHELAFTDRMAKAGINLMETCREGWTPTKFDIKNAEFQDFLEGQWRKLLDGETLQSEVNKSTENTRMAIDKIITLGKRNDSFRKRVRNTLDDEEYDWESIA